MNASRFRLTVPLAVLATLALMLAAVAPALAAQAGRTPAGATLAEHVEDCNADVTLDAEGDLVVTVDGVGELSAPQLAALDAATLAALYVAAEANVNACVSVTIGEGALVEVDADIEHCATVELVINGDGSVDFNGVTIDAELLDPRLVAALELAAEADADAGADACIRITVDSNEMTVDIRTDVIVTLCATLIVDANGDATVNGTAFQIDQFVDNSIETDFTAEVEVGIEITATLEADGDIFVVLTAVDRPGCGATGPGGGTAGEVTIMIMKHNCEDVMTEAEFLAVEARAATNPTTPDAAFGKTVETVLECPTVVLPGDEQTPDTVQGGESLYDFTVVGGDDALTLSTDGEFAQLAACETGVEYDANRDGDLDDDVCLDLSHYSVAVASGTVTVTETDAPDGFSFGALRFTPGSGDEATLVSAADGVIVLDTSEDADGMVMLHVYNFAAQAVTPTPAPTTAPTPLVSLLPDSAALDRGADSGFSGTAGIVALVGLFFLATITLATGITRRRG